MDLLQWIIWDQDGEHVQRVWDFWSPSNGAVCCNQQLLVGPMINHLPLYLGQGFEIIIFFRVESRDVKKTWEKCWSSINNYPVWEIQLVKWCTACVGHLRKTRQKFVEWRANRSVPNRRSCAAAQLVLMVLDGFLHLMTALRRLMLGWFLNSDAPPPFHWWRWSSYPQACIFLFTLTSCWLHTHTKDDPVLHTQRWTGLPEP